MNDTTATGDDARRALEPLDDLATSGVLMWLVGYLGHAADADMSLTAGEVLALIVERCVTTHCIDCGRFVGRDGVDGQCRACIDAQYNRESDAERRHLTELVTPADEG